MYVNMSSSLRILDIVLVEMLGYWILGIGSLRILDIATPKTEQYSASGAKTRNILHVCPICPDLVPKEFRLVTPNLPIPSETFGVTGPANPEVPVPIPTLPESLHTSGSLVHFLCSRCSVLSSTFFYSSALFSSNPPPPLPIPRIETTSPILLAN